jgi:hypothetical protein
VKLKVACAISLSNWKDKHPGFFYTILASIHEVNIVKLPSLTK